MAPRLRVVVAKPGLDGHDRGAKNIARALRDAGMVELLREQGAGEVKVEAFTPGASTDAIVDVIRETPVAR